ncbi:MAG: metal ABC transporter substrate-binding protein [Sporomusaceae bacterium]|nr:metal ABC transporter substrate-binding protein [Sporomusaceae bacterium]
MKKVICLIIVSSLIFLLSGCAVTGNSFGDKRIKVVASVYPVYEFAQAIGGDKINLSLLAPPGAEPHDWEPSAKDLVKIREAGLFLYQGNGFEPWVDKMLTQNKTTSSVAVSHDIETLSGIGEDDEEDLDAAGKPVLTIDPHIWLDPVLAVQEANNICEALVSVDPANEAIYRKNLESLTLQLTALDQEYAQAVQKFERKDFVTTHAAFGYLAKRYGLHQVPLMGLAPDAEPTPEKLAQVSKFCREHKVKAVFFETLVSPKLANMLGKETGAAVLVLNPIEGLTEKETKAGNNYFSVMQENLKNLKVALQ